LIYLDRESLQGTLDSGIRVGSVLLVVALLILGFAKWGAVSLPPDIRLSLSMFALVTWWFGSVVFCFGRRIFQAFRFPLSFLFWMVPIPGFALDEIIHFLQHQSAFAARILFMAAGVPVTQDGILLSIPGLDIEVARECSSIRSSLMLVITTMVLAHLFLRSVWRKALLIAAAVPLAAVKNGLRIFVISELGTRVDPGFFDGNLHHRGGIIFFAISVILMALVLWVLQRTESLESDRFGAAPWR
jgi:exosortase